MSEPDFTPDTLPILWPDDTPRVRRTDDITSNVAADRSTLSVATSHDVVWQVFIDAATPLTEEQVVARAKAWPYMSRLSVSRLRTAVAELARERVLAKSTTPSGVTDAGNPAFAYSLRDAAA